MTPNCEHVVVTKHDHEGRILEFIKKPIGLAVAESLMARGMVDSENRRGKALLSETTSLLEKSMALRDHAAKKAKPKLPSPVAAARPALALPAPAVARRSPPRSAEQEHLDAAQKELKELKQEFDDLRNKEILLASGVTLYAEGAGHDIGRSVFAKSLEAHEGSPAGSRAEISGHEIDEAVRTVLGQLHQQDYFPVKAPETRDAFVKGFRAGADAAIAEFNERHAVA
jgi:hypothetical protein